MEATLQSRKGNTSDEQTKHIHRSLKVIAFGTCKIRLFNLPHFYDLTKINDGVDLFRIEKFQLTHPKVTKTSLSSFSGTSKTFARLAEKTKT